MSTIAEKIRDLFKNCEIGNVLTCGEIIDMVVSKYHCNRDSVIPSDYCYNRTNRGINFDKSLHIFEYLSSKKYRYLGENSRYAGFVYHKPRGGNEITKGKWVNGVYSNE